LTNLDYNQDVVQPTGDTAILISNWR